MFTKKLNSLHYDQEFNIEDESQFRQLIYWLENMKIRFYPPESRNTLLFDAPTWNEAFEKYLKEMECTVPLQNRERILDWLLNLALRYEMEDAREQLQLSKESIAELVNTNTGTGLIPMDVNSKEFTDGLRDLCDLLNVPFYQEEPLVTLRAVAILLKRLQSSNVEVASNKLHPSDMKKKKLVSQVDESILRQPFSKTVKYDPSLNRAANVLRLLYINDLRLLQTQINAMIVQVQSLTANPKTDTTLGKVGR